MSNIYKTMKDKHSKEFGEFPMVFAFNNAQFEEGMKQLGLDVTDTDKVCKFGGGGFYKKTDSEALRKMMRRQEYEMRQAVTNESFVYAMFDYELGNHEYGCTQDTSSALSALGLTQKEIDDNEILSRCLAKACKEQREWYLIHG